MGRHSIDIFANWAFSRLQVYIGFSGQWGAMKPFHLLSFAYLSVFAYNWKLALWSSASDKPHTRWIAMSEFLVFEGMQLVIPGRNSIVLPLNSDMRDILYVSGWFLTLHSHLNWHFKCLYSSKLISANRSTSYWCILPSLVSTNFIGHSLIWKTQFLVLPVCGRSIQFVRGAGAWAHAYLYWSFHLSTSFPATFLSLFHICRVASATLGRRALGDDDHALILTFLCLFRLHCWWL